MAYEPYVGLPDGTEPYVEAARKRAGFSTKGGYLRHRVLDVLAHDLGVTVAELEAGEVEL